MKDIGVKRGEKTKIHCKTALKRKIKHQKHFHTISTHDSICTLQVGLLFRAIFSIGFLAQPVIFMRQYPIISGEQGSNFKPSKL
jgi:hypothetical protein